MKFDLTQDDPMNILSSTKDVVENSTFVAIDPKSIKKIAKVVGSKLTSGLEDAEVSFGAKGNLEKDAQLILVEDSVNFCFWAEKDKPKWQVEWPKGKIVTGGWYGLVASFERAMAEGVPVLDADFLSNISLSETENLFRGANGTVIPLIKERMDNLIETGKVLNEKYDGKFTNLIEQSGFDALEIVKLVTENFKSFRDTAFYDGKEVCFYKRAQIVASDLTYLQKYDKRYKLKGLEKLTAFADYKVPQILRNEGVLIYDRSLSEKVDNYVLIPAGSKEEVEIRSATVWGVELIKQELKNFTASQIDNAIWLISQDQSGIEKPYHRTYSIYY